ncbi:MAG: AP2 domain-containing protein [Paludibacteraceae bacterium]
MQNLTIIYPNNRFKYTGTIFEAKLKTMTSFRVRIKTDTINYNKNVKTQEEAEQILKQKNIELGAPIKNICYDAGSHVIMELTQGKFCKFDHDVFDLLDNYIWHIANDYVCAVQNGKTVRMHKLIMQDKELKNDETIDHINRDTCDNRTCNLRVASPQTQCINRKVRNDNPSGIRGVHCNSSNNCWAAVWMDLEGKHCSKSFSISKYGEGQAKQFATDYRKQMELTLPHYIEALKE